MNVVPAHVAVKRALRDASAAFSALWLGHLGSSQILKGACRLALPPSSQEQGQPGSQGEICAECENL